MIRYQQRYIKQSVAQLVTLLSSRYACYTQRFADVLKLIDQIKKEEKRQKPQRYQSDSARHLFVNKSAYGVHLAALAFRGERLRAERSVQFASRLASQAKLASNTPPCRASSRAKKLIFSADTQVMPKLIALL